MALLWCHLLTVTCKYSRVTLFGSVAAGYTAVNQTVNGRIEMERELNKDVEKKKGVVLKRKENGKMEKGENSGIKVSVGLKVCVCRDSDGWVRVSPAAAVAS